MIAIVLPRSGSDGAAQAEQRHGQALRPFAHRPFAGRLETIHLDLARPDVLDPDIANIWSGKRRFNLGNWRADRNRGCNVGLRLCRDLNLRRHRRGGRIVRQRRRLFGMRVQQRFDRKDVVRIGVFQRWRGLHWRSLAQSNVTRIGRRACFAALKTLCPESPLPKPPHGQRGLTKARRSCGEVAAGGSGRWNRTTKTTYLRITNEGDFTCHLPFIADRGFITRWRARGRWSCCSTAC